jgi:hypothetical protein
MSATNGSGLFSKQVATLDHLVRQGGLGGEIADVRKDVAKVLKPLVAVTVEEYDYPSAAGVTTVLAATLSTLASSVTYRVGGNGLAFSPPRNVEVVVAGSGTPTHMSHSVVVAGLDANGNKLSETITGTNGGAATYSGVKCFALVETVAPSADGGGIDATFSVLNGVVIGLSQTPKLRTGQTLGAIRRELMDGTAPTAGALTAPATNPPNGAYTPNTAPATQAPATTTGSADITAAGLYGVGGTLAGGGTPLVLVLTVNGVGPTTLTFDGAGLTNDASEAAMLAAIVAAFPGLLAVQGGAGGNKLVLTTALQDTTADIIVAATLTSTSNTALGLTPGTYHGAGHRYAIEYEYDATLQKDA